MATEFDGFLASGTINPARFVSMVSGSRGYVQQATASTFITGVSQEGTYYPPGTAADTGAAGIDGQPLKVYGPARTALLKLGGTVSAGDRLTSDASGQGVAVSTSATAHTYVGGIALDNGTSGQYIRIRVWPYDGPQSN